MDDPKALLEGTTPGPWQWVDPDTDLPCEPDRPCAEGDHGDHAYRLSLRTVKEYPTKSVGPLPRFIIHVAEELQGYQRADGTWHHPDARLIAAAPDLARTVVALADERDALRAERDELAALLKEGLTLHVEADHDLAALRARLEEAERTILALHVAEDEEAEVWIDGPGEDLHAEGWPGCTDCHGHTITVQVCRECGYEHDGDQAFFRPWPCPTARAFLADPKEPT